MAAPPPPFFTPSAPGLGVGQSCPVCSPTAANDTGGNWRMGTSCGFGGAGFVLFVLTIVKFIQAKRLGNNAAPPAAMVAYTPAISPAPASATSTPAPAASASAPAFLPPPPAPAGYGYGYVAQPMLLVPSTPAQFAYAAPPPPPPPVEDDGSAAAAYSAGFAAGAASLSGCATADSTLRHASRTATADSPLHASSYRSQPYLRT